MMQNLKSNWLVISKLTWEIWGILTRAFESLKNFHFNVLLLSKVYIFWAKTVQRNNLSWNWRGIQNWRGIELSFQNWHKNFEKIWPEYSKVSKNFHFNELLLSKVYIVWAKKVQRNNLSWNWRGMQNLERNRLFVSNWHKEFGKIWPKHSKVSKIFTLRSSFWAKYRLFELEKYRGIIFHETEEACKIWRGIDFSFQIGITNLTKFDPSTRKSQKFSL